MLPLALLDDHAASNCQGAVRPGSVTCPPAAGGMGREFVAADGSPPRAAQALSRRSGERAPGRREGQRDYLPTTPGLRGQPSRPKSFSGTVLLTLRARAFSRLALAQASSPSRMQATPRL